MTWAGPLRGTTAARINPSMPGVSHHYGPAVPRPATFEDYRDYHLAVGGFIDLRPHAIVCTARNEEQDLTGLSD